jgi:drug/metabolite transporter (DMT)-like permease
LKRGATPISARYLRYFATVAIISYAFPNTLVLAAIPHLGSGLTAIFFTLSPMMTVVLSRLAGLRSPSNFEYAGIATGFLGALLVAASRGEVGRPAEWIWVVTGFLIPLSLAIGNVYRSLDWPEDADPLWLAVGSNAASAIILMIIGALTGALAQASLLLTVPLAAGLQIAAGAAMFLFYFPLQAVGGPVTLSQIGTVAAGVGTVIGWLVLGERYPEIVRIGVALIAAGLALTIWARRRG